MAPPILYIYIYIYIYSDIFKKRLVITRIKLNAFFRRQSSDDIYVVYLLTKILQHIREASDEFLTCHAREYVTSLILIFRIKSAIRLSEIL